MYNVLHLQPFGTRIPKIDRINLIHDINYNITMFYQFKKNDFLVLCQQQQGGALVTVSRDGHIGQNLCFGTVTPGNLYMLSNNQWTLLDVKGMVGARRKYGDYMERAAAALSVAITRLPIGDKYLKLELGEFRLLETVVYDIATSQRIS